MDDQLKLTLLLKKSHLDFISICIFQPIKYCFLTYAVDYRFDLIVVPGSRQLCFKIYNQTIIFLNPFKMRAKGCFQSKVIQCRRTQLNCKTPDIIQ
ncbi:hypothetical protein D3C73_1370650 [compost metagenome]